VEAQNMGLAADMPTHGGGSDPFRFDAPLVASNIETITDFPIGATKSRSACQNLPRPV